VWADNPPVICGTNLLVTPEDSAFMLVIDVISGRVLAAVPAYYGGWSFCYMSAGGEGNVFLYGDGVMLVDGLSARPVLSSHFRSENDTIELPEPAVGRGLVSGEMVYVPCKKNLYCVDFSGEQPRVVPVFRWEHPREEAGMVLLGARSLLVSVSQTEINVYSLSEAGSGKEKEDE
jgi:hypothetical protein